MRTYRIKRATRTPALSGEVKGTAWQSAEALAVDNWPWYVGGDKQPTEIRVLYDDRAIYVQFQCVDRHIYSRTTELNGPVYKDSCAEFFAGTDPDAGPEYFNFEANCCGVFHLGFGSGRHDRRLITPELASRVEVASSERGPIRDEKPDDSHWWVAARLPLDVLSEFTGRTVAPKPGDQWRANFYRIGGRLDGQYACWSLIELPTPDYHRPEFFGQVVIE